MADHAPTRQAETRKGKTMKLEIRWVDATANEGYWQYNETRHVADIEIRPDATNEEAEEAILAALKMKGDGVRWNVEGDLLEMVDAETDEPRYCATVIDN